MRSTPSLFLPRVLLSLLLGLLVTRAGTATVAILSSDAALTGSSQVVLTGKVVSVTSQKSGEEIYTYIRLDVGRVLKGNVKGRQVVVKQLGGTVEDVTMVVESSPIFKRGERVLLFLDTWADGALRVTNLFMGKYDVVRDARTGKDRVVRKVNGRDTHLLRKRLPGEITAEADLAEFQKKISEMVRTKVAAVPAQEAAAVVEIPREYHPVAKAGSETGLSSETAPFVLLRDGNVYRRWFEPDSGAGLGFWFNLSFAPTANAHDSLMNALGAWTNVTSSRVRLDFSGYATAGGFYPDFFSMISFEDPLGQLADPNPYDCSGIVAGSSYVRRNNEFRVVNRVGFYRVLESDVVFNNGWTAGPCPLFLDDPSTKIIEEVATHELGHSLGLDHSNLWDPIMRATIHNNGRGAWLGLDDVTGISFIYPEPGNPIDDPRFYAGWQYPDWLDRGPDPGGWNNWTAYLTACGSDTACMAFRRKDLPLGFIYSSELQARDPRLSHANWGTPAYNQTLVEELYLRYWKRAMDSTDWVSYLNSKGSQVTNDDYRTVVEAFITSDEYRSRFDPDICNPYDQQVCNSNGPNWSWNPFSCTCEYQDPCAPYYPYCL